MFTPWRGCLLVWVFAAAAAQGEQAGQQVEQDFRAAISADNIGGYIRDLTQHPNFPGSAFGRRNAETVLEKFRQWGWDAHIESFSVPFPRPTARVVELVQPTAFAAKLHEPPVAGDEFSLQQAEHLESYFIYGPDGDVTAPLVYVNFGLREDYEQLERMGVSVKGAIVLIRYGRLWRGGKVELAAEHGAVGALIYSDPREDGYFQGPTYPDGSFRNPDAVQRGSVLNGKYPGDPLTPFVGATAGAARLPVRAAATVAAIPSSPLSYSDALPLLAALGGATVPEDWRGALPVTYRTGPGPARVHLKVSFRWDRVEFFDVIAKLAGNEYPDEWVIRGNHHDGWVYGAQDPHSGHSALLEEARVLGQMYKAGWRPKRTIVYASWDGEEQGTIGSTEWMETHFAELQRHAVLYLNSDVTMVGSVRMSGSPALESFLRGVADDIEDPRTGVSIVESSKEPLSVGPPGYGSDHHAFVARSGIPTVNLDFFGDGFGGSYHSIYDDYAWYTRFNDPGFLYGRATAQLIGTTVIRYAQADLLPFDFRATAEGLARELDALRKLLNPTHASGPDIDLTSLTAAVETTRQSAQQYAKLLVKNPPASWPAPVRAELNAALRNTERAFLRKGGLPERPYYLNEVYSPGRLWDTVPLPAIGDALLDGKLQQARQQIPLVADRINAIARAIDAATAVLARASSDPAARFVGRWTGVAVERQGNFRTERGIDIEFRLADAGGLEFLDHDRGTLRSGAVPVTLAAPQQITVSWHGLFPGELTATGTLSNRNDALSWVIRGDHGMSLSHDLHAALRRDDPNVLRFAVPRLAAGSGNGSARQIEWSYEAPMQSGDGWAVSTVEREGLDPDQLRQILDPVLRQSGDPASNTTHGLLIARHGKLVLEEYFWGYEAGLAHGISSCTKSLTSMLAGLASDRGKLQLSDRVAAHFSDYSSTHWVGDPYAITVAQLLAMNAGIEWNEDVPYQDPHNTTRPMLEAKDPLAFMFNQPLAFAPGSHYQYNSGLPLIAGTLLERELGEPLEKFAARTLFDPMGIRNYRWARLPDGKVLAAGGFEMLPRDMLKIGQLMLNGGIWNGKRVLSADWVRESTSQQTPPGQYAYGFYWHLITPQQWQIGGESGYMAAGQGGQFIIVLPRLDLVYVVTSGNWQPGGTRSAFDQVAARIVRAVRLNHAG